MKQALHWEENPERMKMVFRQRALLLAKESAASQPASPGFPALTVRLGEERYAIALSELAEVLPFRGCTPVPGASAPFLGVMNLRGELRPVIDLAWVLAGSASTDSGAVLLIPRQQSALKVDAVEDLREIRPEKLSGPIQGHYIKAFVAGTVGLLDVETMLSALLSPKESRPI